MSFTFSDAGRSKSLRPKQRNDCTVRALALCLSLKYDQAFDILKAAGRKNNGAFNLEKWLRTHTVTDGFGDQVIFRLEKIGRAPGQTKLYRISDFWRDHWQEPPGNNYIVSCASHVFGFVNSSVVDDRVSYFTDNRPVYGWMKPTQCKWPWQAYAVRKPIKPGGRPYRRPLGIINGMTKVAALGVAAAFYEHQLRKGEDLDVIRYTPR